VASKEDILKLEDAIVDNLTLTDLPVDHYFSDELYARALHIPADTVLTGKEHKRDHINFLMKGDIQVLTENGIERFVAPAIIPAKKGIKRAGYAFTDTIWVTVHHCIATNVEDAENEIVEPSRPHIAKAMEKVKLEVIR